MNKTSVIASVLCLATIACASLRHSASREPAEVYSDYGANASYSDDEKLTFSKFLGLIVASKVKDVDHALPVLSAQYKKYMYYHTLMYSSFSIQGSSFEQPRAIVYGPEAKFIFTFNGKNSQAGGNELESVEFDEAQKKFLFREIIFKSSKFDISDIGLTADEIDFQNETLLVSKANPQKCLQCHGQNASPIWQAYFNWPGAFGSNDDQLGMSFENHSWNGNNSYFFSKQTKPTSVGRSVLIKPGAKDTELDGYIRYAKAKPTHPRYKWLPEMPTEVGARNYSLSGDWPGSDVSVLSKDLRENLNETNSDWPARPNLILLERLSALNMAKLRARLNEANVAENSLTSPLWDDLIQMRYATKKVPDKSLAGQQLDPSNGLLAMMEHVDTATIADATTAIQRVLSGFAFKNSPPTFVQIQKQLIKNLQDEFTTQQEKMETEDTNFGAGTLIAGHPDRGNDSRAGFDWIGSSSSFYRKLMPLRKVTTADRMAFTLEATDQVLMTAIDLYLLDHGVDLHDYNMNVRQESLNFHSYLEEAINKYLGIKRANQ